ncbi:MAG: trypsin-like peptidase domain-containing protein [Verrucomicrobiales bacterium]|jgi:hypothetical protein|nr:trypsin-like peptidase domain-containing protein [Verrucomicrobiales bacterium]
MVKVILMGFLLCSLALTNRLHAVVVVTSGTVYNSNEPTTTNIRYWNTGWGSSSVTGWDYVGTVGGASAVYLGNGWVISAAHVDLSSNTYTLDGVTYTIIADSVTTIGNTDLVLFQISTALDLPTLTISSSSASTGQSVVMIGYGGGTKAWGTGTINGVNYELTLDNGHTSTYYYVKYNSINNTTQAISGDSGGAGFVYNSTTGQWELSGLLDAIATDDNGGYYTLLIDLSSYSDDINTIVSSVSYIPEPACWALLLLGCPIILLLCQRKKHFAAN